MDYPISYLKGKMMHCFFIAAIFALASVHATANDLGISLRIGQPGFYGEIQLGDYYPAPELIYPEPVIIHSPQVHISQPPIYLHVPPGQASLWHRYCYHYNACNQPVYFIRENWYNNVYIPHHHKHDNRQPRHYNSPQHRQDNSYPKHRYDSDRHYQNKRHESHRYYNDDHDYRKKRHHKDNGHDKHNRRDQYDRSHRSRKDHD